MKIAIIGTVGVPGRYGGFETLAENLVRHHARSGDPANLTVWCSAKDNTKHPLRYKNAELKYVNLRANGAQSVLYDIVCLSQAVWNGYDRIVLLGVSGALALPFVRSLSRATITTNIDGIEWKREKWNRIARLVLRISEWAAVKYSHNVIADNQAISEYVDSTYNRDCHVIAYGGDHALDSGISQPFEPSQNDLLRGLPKKYSIALCRIEPENNVHTILESWANVEEPLVFVGNWDNSTYGRNLRRQFGEYDHLYLMDPIYDPTILFTIRQKASCYIHGHSAGGTNPSLVEMMHFGIPIIAYDCVYNRFSTENKSVFFTTSDDLRIVYESLNPRTAIQIGSQMKEIANRKYTWKKVAKAYFQLIARDYHT